MNFQQNINSIKSQKYDVSKFSVGFMFCLTCLGCSIDAKIFNLEHKKETSSELPPGSNENSSGTISDLGLVFDGIINASLIHDNKLYLGGKFSNVGVNKGALGSLSMGGEISASSLQVNGDIRTMIKDSAGRTYIGGSFTRVGNVERKYLARILVDGTLDESFDAQIIGLGGVDFENGGLSFQYGLNKMFFENNVIYFVGSFSKVLGQDRLNGASINILPSSISIGSWNPKFDMSPTYFDVKSGKVTAGSQFIMQKGTTFRGAAYFDDNGEAHSLYAENDTPLFLSVIEDGQGGHLGKSFNGSFDNMATTLVHLGSDGKIKKKLSGTSVIDAKVVGSLVYVYFADGSSGAKLEKYSLETFAKISNWSLDISCSSSCGSGSIEVYNGNVYVFTDGINAVNSLSRNKAFSVNENTGVLTAFDIPTFQGLFAMGDAIIRNNRIYVIMSNFRLGVFNLDGSENTEFSPSVALNQVISIAFDGSGRLYVSTESPSKIYALNALDGSVIPDVVIAGANPLVLPGHVTLTSNRGKIYGMYFDPISGTSLYILDGNGGYQQKLIGASTAIVFGMFTRFCDSQTESTKGVCLFSMGLGGEYSSKNYYSYDIATQSEDGTNQFDYPSSINTLFSQFRVGNRIVQYGAYKASSTTYYTYVFDAITKQELFSETGEQNLILNGTSLILDKGLSRLDLTMSEPLSSNQYINIGSGGVRQMFPVGDGRALVLGDFDQIDGVPCNGIAHIDENSGAISGTPPTLSPEISLGDVTIATASLNAGGSAYLGFVGGGIVFGQNVSKLISIDLTTLSIDDLEVNGTSVNALYLDLDNVSVPTLFVGGTGLSQWRSNLVANDLLALNLATPLATTSIYIGPVVDSQGSGQSGVSAIQKFDDKIYVGTFSSTLVDSTVMPLFALSKAGANYNIASDYFIADTGALPNITDLKTDGDRLYLLGSFTQLDKVEAGSPLGSPVNRRGFAVINKMNQINNFDLGVLSLRFPASANESFAKAKLNIADGKLHIMGVSLDSDPTKNLVVVDIGSNLSLLRSDYVLGESFGLALLMGMFSIGDTYLFSGLFSTIDGESRTNVFSANLGYLLSPDILEMPDMYSIYTGGAFTQDKYYLIETNLGKNNSSVRVIDLLAE